MRRMASGNPVSWLRCSLALLLAPGTAALLATPAELFVARVPCRAFDRHPRVLSQLPAPNSGGSALSKQFEDAMESLQPAEQYNAVLLSLLARGDGKERTENAQRAIELVLEMTSRRLKLTSASTKLLVDATARADELPVLLRALSAARENGACRAFAASSLRLPDRPSPSAAASLKPVPADERSSEVTAAFAFTALVLGTLGLEVADVLDFLVGADYDAPPLPLVAATLVAGWAYDRYAQRGEIVATVGRGLSRLFSRDLQRECTTESASFMVGYLLGLPCCAFMPTATRPLDMIAESKDPMSALTGRDGSARLVDRLLIWLLAPVAAEKESFGDLVTSDPSVAANLLSAARRREASLGIDVSAGGWADDPAADEARLRWAFSEARRLLQRYSGMREELQEQMVAGVSVGDCVVLIEERCKNQWGMI